MTEEIAVQVKIKLINMIELAYKKDKGITVALIRSKGPFTRKSK